MHGQGMEKLASMFSSNQQLISLDGGRKSGLYTVAIMDAYVTSEAVLRNLKARQSSRPVFLCHKTMQTRRSFALLSIATFTEQRKIMETMGALPHTTQRYKNAYCFDLFESRTIAPSA